MLVEFAAGVSTAARAQIAAQVGGQIHAEIAPLGVRVLKVPAGNAPQVVAQLSEISQVVYAELNYVAHALDTVPNDPSWGSQYGPLRVQGPQAWDITTGATSVVVAVVDTGVDLSHPDLAGKIVAGYDFVNGDATAQDDHGHGTHVAGIAAATSNNGIGIAGVSWGARVMPVKVLDSSGSGSYADVASGVTWAADHGAKVINLSLGGTSPSTTLENAINYAYGRGVTVVAAAGNSGDSTPNYPAVYTNTIAVAATDSNNNRASFSTYGAFVDIAAPGVSIYATVPTGSCSLCDGSGYRSLSGTSMATPHVAGVAALLASLPQFDTPDKVRTAIQNTALDLGGDGWDQFYGWGLVQAYSALLYYSGATPTATLTPTITNTPNSACTAAFASLEQAASPDTPSPNGAYSSDEVLVKFRAGTSDAVANYYVDAFGATVSGELAELGVMVLKVPVGEVTNVVSGLNGLQAVEYAEPNYVARAFDTIPNDASWVSQYGPLKVQAPGAWDLTTGSTSVTIAVVDTGVDLNHPDLAAKVVSGCDFVNRDESAQDDNGHGTHVAGIAAAVSNNGIGIAGVSWGARIMPVKVLNSSGSGTYDQVAAGIIFAADNGAQVINLSLGGSASSSVLENAVNYAVGRGVIVVAAAGNSGTSTPSYPAAYQGAIAVAATDANNERASFSTYGSFVDLAAPGVSIYSTYLDDIYASLSGTSMATPHVAGAAALLYGYSANLDTAVEVRTALESTALDLGASGWDQYYGHGLLQLRSALLFDPGGVTPTPTQTPSPTFTPTPIPQTYYYVRSDICSPGFTYGWVDATGGTNLNLAYDDSFATVSLPFAFTFNGQPRSQAYVSTNGFIAFESDGAAAYLNRAIPDTSVPNEFIAPFWDDLNPFYGGNVYTTTVGTAPNRRFVVEWKDVPHYRQEGAHTFQVLLLESSNEIIFQYGSMTGAYAFGNSATIGLEYAGGTTGLQFSYNTADAVHDGLALKFAVATGATPTPAPTCAPTSTPTNTPSPTPIVCYTLTLSASPASGGSISTNPAPNCSGGTQYISGTAVQLTANAASNYYRFNSWSGDASSATNPVSVTMSRDKSVAAAFDQATFGDVPFDHPHYRHIEALWQGGFTAGCSSSPLLYCPDTILNRAQSAVFVLRGQFGTSYTPPTTTGTFADDWSKGAWGEKWAEGMWTSGFTAGCNTSPRQYCPWQDHTRTEASVFYLRIKYGASYVPPAPTGILADVDLNWWGAKWAEQAYRDGLLPACGTAPGGDPMFCPDDLLTRAWAAYMMVQAKNLPLP